jgi:uncharacterized protein
MTDPRRSSAIEANGKHPALGRVVATERRPNTPHEFHFWTALDSPVGIGTIVRVDGTHPVGGHVPHVYGVVVEGFSYTDVQSPMYDVLGFDGTPGAASMAATERAEIRLYTAHVLRQVPEEPLQPVPMGEVFLADERDIEVALRMDGYLREGSRTGIPMGVYRAGGTESPIYLDADFLLGPEAAHLNITGVSGLATKTSAVEWMLQSIFAHFPGPKGSVAAVAFNVKGPDLCFLDQAGTLDDADRALYERCSVPAEPFERVRYFAPFKSDGFTLNTLRSNEALLGNVTPLTWGLREVLQFAEVLLNKDDVDAKADALIDFIKERVLDREFSDPQLVSGKRYVVRSFADLDEWFKDVILSLEQRGIESWRTHHVATIRKVRNRLSNISTRCAGLVTDDGSVSDLPYGSFEDRAVYVVDVASLEEDAQDLIFARIVSKLREHLERRDLGSRETTEHYLRRTERLDGGGPELRSVLEINPDALDIADAGAAVFLYYDLRHK